MNKENLNKQIIEGNLLSPLPVILVKYPTKIPQLFYS